jgi:ferrous iron transport protein A
MTLNDAPIDVDLEVVRLSGDPHLRARLAELGFLPAETARAIRRGVGRNAPLAVRVGSSTYALRPAEASCIEVNAIVR